MVNHINTHIVLVHESNVVWVPEEALSHFGVKGMKWGQRKSDISASSDPRPKRTPEEKKALAKKVAMGTGALILAAGTAYAMHELKQKGGMPVSKASSNSKGKKVVDNILKDPTSVILASKSKHTGFEFFKDGQSPSPLDEMIKGFNGDINKNTGFFNRYEGKIAANFDDPKGRKDRSGRVIPHSVIIPKSMTDGINNLDDVIQKIWPIVEPSYNYNENAGPSRNPAPRKAG